MSTLVEQAIDVLRALPENLQASAARAIIDYASLYEDERSTV
jgi:hypothetical protein